MNRYLVVLILVFLLNQGYSQEPFQPDGELVFVVEAFRHGARYTIYTQFWDGKQQAQDAGELSPTGIRQQYGLGQFLRAEYVDKRQFVLPQYNHTQFLIQSTDVNRTLMSAYSQFQGFYPPFEGPVLSSNIQSPNFLLPPYNGAVQPDLYNNQSLPQQIQVLPVITVPYEFNIVLSAEQNCQTQINAQWAQFQNQTTFLQQIDTYYSTTYANLQQVVNYSQPINSSNIENLYDVLIADLYNGRPLPIGMTNELWNNLTALDSLWWAYKYAAQLSVSKLINSNILTEIFDTINAKISGSYPLLKWSAYSGHDSNIAPLMYALGLFDLNCTMNKFMGTKYPTQFKNCFNRPAYVANVLIELYNNSGNYSIALRYEGQYVSPCNTNSLQCSYSDFQAFLNRTIITPQQWVQTCNYTPPMKPSQEESVQNQVYAQQEQQQEQQQNGYNASQIISIILGVVLMIQIGFVLRMIHNKYKNKQFYSGLFKSQKDISSFVEISTQN